MKWFEIGMLIFALGRSAHAQLPDYTWTSLVPADETRAADIRKYDKNMLLGMIASMNATEQVFRQRLTWKQIAIQDLLTARAPFCEIDFDPVHPPEFTESEKAILKEYLARGGFLALCPDLYPYSMEEVAAIRNWSVIDYIIRELPAADPAFTAEKITESHLIYHQYYKAKRDASDRWAARRFPHLPDGTLVSYKGHPCAFVDSNRCSDGSKWETLDRPFPPYVPLVPDSYALNVNLYIYATMH